MYSLVIQRALVGCPQIWTTFKKTDFATLRNIELVEFSTNLKNTKKDTQMNECLRKKEMFEQAQLVLEFSSPRRIYILAQHDTDDYYKRHLKRE